MNGICLCIFLIWQISRRALFNIPTYSVDYINNDLTFSAFLITSFQRIGKYNLLIRCHNGFIKLFYTHEVGKGCVGAVLGLLIVCINITSMLLTSRLLLVYMSIISVLLTFQIYITGFEFYIHVFYWKYIYIPHDQPRIKSRFTQSAKLMMIVDIISKSNKRTCLYL